MMTSETLTGVSATIRHLTDNLALPEPSTVVVTREHVSILLDMAGAPVNALLSWAGHLDGPVMYDAARFWDNSTTALRVQGYLNRTHVTVSVTVPRVMPILAQSGAGPMEEIPVHYNAVVEFAAAETVL